MTPDSLKLLIILEATNIDGPVRNLFYAVDLFDDDIDVEFATYLRSGSKSTPLTSAISKRGFKCHIIDESRAFDLTAFFQLSAVLREGNFDVIQIHHTKSRLFAAILAFLGKVNRESLIFFFHGFTWTSRRQKIYNLLDKFLFRLAGQCVVVAPEQRNLLESWKVRPSRLTVIPNVIPVGEYVGRELPEKFCFVTAGRLSREKGISYLIDAVALLGQDDLSRCQFMVFGDGPELCNLEELVRKHNLRDVIGFKGYVEDLDDAYSQASCFILPSLSEGMPNVLLESAAQGIPIIATRVGGVPGILCDSRDARLVRPGEARALAEAIRECISNYGVFVQFARSAHHRIRSLHRPEIKAKSLVKLYREIVE